MRVCDLIHYLESCDEDANVITAYQPNYPFEASIENVIQRRDFDDSMAHVAEARHLLHYGIEHSIREFYWAFLEENVEAGSAKSLVENMTIEEVRTAIQTMIDEEEKSNGDAFHNNGRSSDVIILVGSQLRYGTRKMWDM